MNKFITLLLFLLLSNGIFAQNHQFEIIVDLESSNVKSQGETGTCWSFATTSFLESEIYRLTKKQVDIAEMYFVRSTYEQKAWNYVMRQGKTQFSEGGLAHDVINAVSDYGIVPQNQFADVFSSENIYNHSNLVPDVKKILDSYIKDDNDSEYPNWKLAITPILDKEIGEKVNMFEYDSKKFTPHSFAEHLKIVPEDYISLTSFTHEKFFTCFVLNIPDNFANGSFYNLPLDNLVEAVDEALKKGYSLSLDVDVSEKTFITKKGIAILPKTNTSDKIKSEILAEIDVTQVLRQTEFENFNTTDDHLMHITGLVKDQNGKKYYKVKNSWGSNSERVGNDGFIYMSIPYFKMKAISVLLHKDALPIELKNVLKQ